MASDLDHDSFADNDFLTERPSTVRAATTAERNDGNAPAGRPPTREELETRVTETQKRLMELKQAQEALERERAALEEARRRQTEFQAGREEALQNLTRGIGLLDEAEFAARRDAEQMSKTLNDFREALGKMQAIRQETWTDANYSTELTRALTIIENARMEWNAARLKWPVLNGETAEESATKEEEDKLATLLAGRNFRDLCWYGLALTWPLALVMALGLLALLVMLLKR